MSEVAEEASVIPDAPAAAAAPAKSGGIGITLIIVLQVLILAGLGYGGYLFMNQAPASGETVEGEETMAELPDPASYQSLSPPFVVNLASESGERYLQIEVEVMTRDADGIDMVAAHIPRIRNDLLMLFGQQDPKQINTREGKEQLQQSALEEIQKVLKAETGKPIVEGVYFTSFVMQ